jgi:hypothetical protein
MDHAQVLMRDPLVLQLLVRGFNGCAWKTLWKMMG